MTINQGKKTDQAGTLGTFAGVFTPSILTILGIILFLRMGYVVGSAGLGKALFIMGVANLISVLTSFSLAAVATNIQVKGGGDYYLISRTLGISFGGSLGLVLFLAQSVSIAFYCIGFGEALCGMLASSSKFLPQIIAGISVLFLFVFAWLGSDWATKFQYIVMAFLILALVSFYTGGVMKWDSHILVQNWNSGPDSPKFWILFAIFFPAVTGFTQGVSMSGDLKDPGKSLPLGTFLAVGLSILVYFSVAVIFSASMPQEILGRDYGAMKKVAYWGFFIDAGVIAATLSSAMASFLGAPRILQSLAKDKVFAFLTPFGKGFGPMDNPRRGVLLSAAIAAATIALGQLDLIARVVSMFFLISYGLLNYATYFEAKTGSPSFRPRFKWYHPTISLAGFLACLGVMLAIDLSTGIAAIAILFAIYQYLQRTSGPGRWSDSKRSYYLQRVRENLLEASRLAEHPRDWRPYMLALSDDPERRKYLLCFASWLEGGSGMTSAVRFLKGQGLKMRKPRKDAYEQLRKDIASQKSNAFPVVISAPDLETGLETAIQAFGIGPISANTILINWLNSDADTQQGKREILYGQNIKLAFRTGCNIIILNAQADKWNFTADIPPKERIIDIWWWGDKTGNLMLLLAYLLTRHSEWDESRIRVLAANYEKENDENLEDLKKIIDDARIEAECIIVADADADKMADMSKNAALVFMPLRLSGDQPVAPFDTAIEDILSGLGVSALVMAAQDLDLDAAPEDGIHGEISHAMDQMERAVNKLKNAEKEALKAAETARKKMDEIELAGGKIDDAIMIKFKEAVKAREQADMAARRVLTAQVKSENAEKDAESLGISVNKSDEE